MILIDGSNRNSMALGTFNDSDANRFDPVGQGFLNTQTEYDADDFKHQCPTQISLLQVTLDGRTMALTILAIILAIHLFQPSVTCVLVALLPLPWIVLNDFKNFLLLGPGGTPSTFVGYLKITYLRLFALSDPYMPCSKIEPIYPDLGLYRRASCWLPERRGPRPRIAGIAPHRQIDQPGCEKMDQVLRATLRNLAVTLPNLYHVDRSCFEKKGLALFARNPINSTCRGEICHIHHTDGSLHMNLHPDDARIVLGKSFGERHPLSRGGWLKAYVPREFTKREMNAQLTAVVTPGRATRLMWRVSVIYAPRDFEELEVVCRIIEAAIWWVSGSEVNIKIINESRD